MKKIMILMSLAFLLMPPILFDEKGDAGNPKVPPYEDTL